MDVIHDWYWARGQAGPYSVIASYITAPMRGTTLAALPIFMLAKDGDLIGGRPVAAGIRNPRHVHRLGHEEAGRKHHSVHPEYRTQDERYVVTFHPPPRPHPPAPDDRSPERSQAVPPPRGCFGSMARSPPPGQISAGALPGRSDRRSARRRGRDLGAHVLRARPGGRGVGDGWLIAGGSSLSADLSAGGRLELGGRRRARADRPKCRRAAQLPRHCVRPGSRRMPAARAYWSWQDGLPLDDASILSRSGIGRGCPLYSSRMPRIGYATRVTCWLSCASSGLVMIGSGRVVPG